MPDSVNWVLVPRHDPTDHPAMDSTRMLHRVLLPGLAMLAGLVHAAHADTVSPPDAETQAAAPTTLLVDIHALGPTRLAALKQAGGVDWWLELGSEMLLHAPPAALGDNARVIADLGDVDLAEIWLEPRGCQHETGTSPLSAPMEVLAYGGRLALLRGLRRFAPLAPGAAGVLRAPVAGEVIASEYFNHHERPALRAVDPEVLPVVDAIDPARWLARTTQLASWNRSTYGSEIDLARDWIAGQMSAAGLTVTLQSHTFSALATTFTTENVVGTLTGSTLPNEWVIVGAHYDSRNESISSINLTPGAEDNASGCAGVLEMVDLLTRFRPRRSVMFVCYSGEEQGLFGSNFHAQQLQNAGQLGSVRLMLNMDMIGYTGDAQLDVLVETRPFAQALFADFAAAVTDYAPQLTLVTSTNPCCSDHMPYLNRNVPAVLTIENDWNIYPHYHRTTDTADRLSLAMGGGILEMNAAVLAQTAQAYASADAGRVFADGFE
jgi:hypothetical protein